MLRTEGEVRGLYNPLQSDLANVNTLKNKTCLIANIASINELFIKICEKYGTILNKSENATPELFAIYIYRTMQTKVYLNVQILGNA